MKEVDKKCIMDLVFLNLHDTHVPMSWDMRYKLDVGVSAIHLACIIFQGIMHHTTISLCLH